MPRIFVPLAGIALLLASTALFAQQNAPAPASGKAPGRPDCSQAKDPKACQERREKARAAFQKARAACPGKQGTELRDCMRTQLCSERQDPAKCEATLAACKGKKGDELRACLKEQRDDKK